MVRLDVRVNTDYDNEKIKDAIVSAFPIEKSEIHDVVILKKVLKIDEKKEFALTLGVELSPERERGLLKMKKRVSECPSYRLDIPKKSFDAPPVVVGAGPAGLFAALTLAESGACPIVVERGDAVEERRRSVDVFFADGVLDGESNIQFGEGGAGAFSDGKLKVGGMDKYKHKVLSEFVSAGAPEDIIYTVGAHLGTDKLPLYVKAIREKIKSLGGRFIYRAKVTSLGVRDEKIIYAEYEKDGKRERIPTDRVILATGHSAEDTFEMLLELGVKMEAKGFGIGVRIEHPREYINELVLGEKNPPSEIGTASYHLVTHLPSGRSVYSFCMCPGGTVVAAASGREGIVTNGMSEEARMADNSNAAHLVSFTPSDFASASPLAGIELQRKIERRAFLVGGGGYKAPAITMGDFMQGVKPSSVSGVKPSYPCGVSAASVEEYMPSVVAESLRLGIRDFDDWMRGFYYPESVLTGPETRSTSPVRVFRDESYMTPGVFGLYPIGEGAGYAGGIVSSAVDGVRCAERIILAAPSFTLGQ